MRRKVLPLIIVFSALASCSETSRSLVGGGATINTPKKIGVSGGKDVFEMTCIRSKLTSCALEAAKVCPNKIDVLQETPRAGFANGRSTHLIETTFKCR